MGSEHPLASKRLGVEGAAILRRAARLNGTIVGERGFSPVVAAYLDRIEYDETGWAARVISPTTERPIVIADPAPFFGQPIFIHGAVRVEDVVSRWRAGDPIEEVAEDFRIPLEDVHEDFGTSLQLAA